MKKTKIEWCDSTWNPITGCKHGCKYCYARRIAKRFGGFEGFGCEKDYKKVIEQGEFYLTAPAYIKRGKGGKIAGAPYPFDFEPTFHAYRLYEPQRWTKPRTIFVCSMADLFGDWVPDEWIESVFQACLKAPQHRYLFLTKNPGRYCDLHRKGILPDKDNFWFGATFDHSNWNRETVDGRPTTFEYSGKAIHDAGDFYFPAHPSKNRFVSLEPLLYDIGKNIGSIGAEWVIIGAETGNRKGKVVPEKSWVENIVRYCDNNRIPVFMKDSLIPVVGEENMRRELPW